MVIIAIHIVCISWISNVFPIELNEINSDGESNKKIKPVGFMPENRIFYEFFALIYPFSSEFMAELSIFINVISFHNQTKMKDFIWISNSTQFRIHKGRLKNSMCLIRRCAIVNGMETTRNKSRILGIPLSTRYEIQTKMPKIDE